MKYLVISDNHGDREILADVFAKWKKDVDFMFHCGDSELPSDAPIWEGVLKVQGNCDFDSGYPEEVVQDTGVDKVYMTHGHLMSVKTSMMPVTLKAKEVGANIILFGHTHVLGTELQEGILYLNPGSVRLPRGRYMDTPTYAIIDSQPDAYEVQYYDRSHQPVQELAFHFKK